MGKNGKDVERAESPYLAVQVRLLARVQIYFKGKRFTLPGVVCALSTKHTVRSWTPFKSILVSKIYSAAPIIGPHLIPP